MNIPADALSNIGLHEAALCAWAVRSVLFVECMYILHTPFSVLRRQVAGITP